MLLLTTLLAAYADDTPSLLTLANVQGITDEELAAVLPESLFDDCRGSLPETAAFGIPLTVTASPGAPVRLEWRFTLPDDHPGRAFQQCLDRTIREAVVPVMRGREASAAITPRFGSFKSPGSLVGARGRVIEAEDTPEPAATSLTTEQAAQGFSAEINKADNISEASLAAALSNKRSNMASCYSGPVEGGGLSYTLDWSRGGQNIRLTSYTSGMQQTGACITTLLKGITYSDLDSAKRSGAAAFEISFAAPE